MTEIWRAVIKTLGDPPAHRLTAKELNTYISKRRASGTRGQTIRRELQAIKRGFALANMPHPEPWPTARTDKRLRSDPKKQEQAGKLHDPAVVWRWLETLPQDARDEALFIWLTGLRLFECKRVLPDWVRGAGADSPVPAYLDLPAEATKTREARTVGLSQAALEIIQRRMTAPGVQVFSQSNFKKSYRLAAKKIGYPARIIPRDLRHMHLTAGVQLTGDAKAAMEAAGHRDLTTTNRYLHSTEHRTGAIAAAVAGQVGTARSAQEANWLEGQGIPDDTTGLLSRGQLVRIQSGAPNHSTFQHSTPNDDDPMQPNAADGRHRSVGIGELERLHAELVAARVRVAELEDELARLVSPDEPGEVAS